MRLLKAEGYDSQADGLNCLGGPQIEHTGRQGSLWMMMTLKSGLMIHGSY